MLERDEFVRLAVGPFQRELLTYCYRMLGSVQDAEDTVQDTFLRAWRAFDQFDPQRASLRTWLYRVATNVCLTALEHRRRRLLPSAMVHVYEDPDAGPLDPKPEIPWLQPIPDLLLGSDSPDPATIVSSRTSVRLAFVAALQLLPPRQRAALILRDVLAWRSHEVADFLDTSTAAVNSALQRARAQMTEQMPVEEDIVEPEQSDQRAVLDSYVAAFEASDMSALTRLLHRDAVLEMPPFLSWFAGRDAVRRFFAVIWARRKSGAWRMLPSGANRQPAAVAYVRGEDGQLRAHSVQVFTIGPHGIERIVAFIEPALFDRFGMPAVWTPG
ncbi:MAG TPA: sigma-70 family RNA polymerase sigma factor [Chloroflexota bacterium]|nr:sigma-70 family RNA polymerase sigma factor [Chloroflexota bacterium]